MRVMSWNVNGIRACVRRGFGATLKHALDFRRNYYGTQRRPPARPVPLTWASVPEDYDVQIRALRRRLDISQSGLARMVGAGRSQKCSHPRRAGSRPGRIPYERSEGRCTLSPCAG